MFIEFAIFKHVHSSNVRWANCFLCVLWCFFIGTSLGVLNGINNLRFTHFKNGYLFQIIFDTAYVHFSTELDSMFVESSSKEEWSKRGDYFFANKLWHVAAICYRKAGDGEEK